MALATTPMVNAMIRPACKRRMEKPAVVVMEDTRPSTCSYHKQCLTVLMDIYEKSTTMSNESYDSKIQKIAEMVTCKNESNTIFQTFCGISFLDRYQDNAIIACTMQDLDKNILNSSWRMEEKLEDKCFQLLTRMGTIENLSSLDADFICLLCQLCKSSDQYSASSANQAINIFNLLLEIGRSVWPYLKRPLWHSEVFVDFVADIFETIGNRLEELYPKNFCIAWKVIFENLVASKADMSCYSRLRLLAVIEHRHKKWTLPIDVEFYREHIEAVLTRKKEILAFLGFLSSRRKTSLTVKPGRSAADFLKRRQSYESQEAEERCSTSSGDGSEAFNEVFEEDFDENDSVFSPNSSTYSFRNKLLSNTEPEPSRRENTTNGYHEENNKNNDRETLLETKDCSGEDTTKTVCMTGNVKQDSCLIEQNVCTSEQKEYVVERQNVNVDRVKEQVKVQKGMRNEVIKAENIPKETGSNVLKDTGNDDGKDHGNIWQESGNTWQENEDKKETRNEDNIRDETGNGWQEMEDIWQESDNAWQENNTIWEDTQCTDDTISSLRNYDSVSNETNINVPEHRSFLLDRKREVVKVPEKYVGRVIGTQGSVISSIQDESGARVHFVRPQKEKVVPARPAVSMSTVKNTIHNTLGIRKDRTSTTDDDTTEGTKNGESKDETIVKDDQGEEFEFEIIGSNESIEKAKQKIESIISHAKRLENHASPKRGDEFFQNRKRVIIKVSDKYIGRVIGSGGSMIMTIEEDSGAKVTFLKDRRTTEKYRATEPERNIEKTKETKLQNESAKDGEQEERKDVEVEPQIETFKETIRERNTEESKEQMKMREEGKFQDEQKAVETGTCSEEKQSVENRFLPEKGDTCDESTVEAVNAKVEGKTIDEYDFEIIGTDEEIQKAKKRIEYIMKLVDNTEKKPFTRSFSYSAPRRGFGQFQRSLSCPIPDWGESCTGECASCQKGSYCRSFLLEKSKSPSCWIRPEVLALTQDADWAEFIVKTKVDDRTSWRPRKSSNASINSGSSDDISSDCTSPRDSAAAAKSTTDSTDNTFSSVNGNNTSDPGNNTTSEDTTTQVNEDVISSDYN